MTQIQYLYLILTDFSNSNNFWSRPPISLSKVTFAIYRSMPMILWGHKYTNTLWKYNKCAPNIVCIWFGPICQMSITFDPDLRFHFPRWLSESTNRCRSSCEVANTPYLIFVIFWHRHHFQLKIWHQKRVNCNPTDFATKQRILNYLLTKAEIQVKLWRWWGIRFLDSEGSHR